MGLRVWVPTSVPTPQAGQWLSRQWGTKCRRQLHWLWYLNKKFHHKGSKEVKLACKGKFSGSAGIRSVILRCPPSCEHRVIIFSSGREKRYREGSHITQFRLTVSRCEAQPLSVRSATTLWIPGAICTAGHRWRICASDCKHLRDLNLDVSKTASRFLQASLSACTLLCCAL